MGVAFALASMLCFATNILISRYAMARMDVDSGFFLVLATSVIAGLAAFAFELSWRAAPFVFQPWEALVFSGAGLIGAFLGRRLLYDTVRQLGPARTSVFHSCAPVPTLFFAWLIVGETLRAYELALMAIVIIVSLLSDIVEQIAAETGRRSEGLLFAFNGLLQKVVTGVGTFGAGLMLAFVGFPEHAVPGQINPDIPRNLVLLWLPIAVSLSVVTLVVLHRLDVTREQHEANLAKIDAAAIPGDLTGTLLTSGVRSVPEGEIRL